MPNTLEDFLDSADGAGNVLAHAKFLLRLANLYREIAPAHLCQASKVANYKSGTLVIHAANGAVAVKLRQLATTLSEGFRRRGVECSSLLVKVQTSEIPARSTRATHHPLSRQSSHSLEELRDALPESDLRQAVDTLLQRAAREE